MLKNGVKMKSKKKVLGQFFTNQVLADFMVKLTINEKSKKMLDPAVGMGVFTKLVNVNNPSVSITACEVDNTMAENFRVNNCYPYKLLVSDYLTTSFNEKFDAIICNPPYNKFQEIHFKF